MAALIHILMIFRKYIQLLLTRTNPGLNSVVDIDKQSDINIVIHTFCLSKVTAKGSVQW